MARRPSDQPTEGELELLRILWDRGPSELGALSSAIRETRPVATTTVATMLKIMLGKGLVSRARKDRVFVWSACVTRGAAQKKLLANLIDRAFNGSAQLLVARLLSDKQLSAKDRREILAMLAGSKPRSPGD